MANPPKQENSFSRFLMIKARHKETLETALRQGKVDEQMHNLCSFVAGTKNYYTSSCCSGRIVLLEKRGEKKIETSFHRKWHRKVSLEEIMEALGEQTVGELWFKAEPFILHIGCKSLEEAKKVLQIMKKAGVKRGGIIVAEPEKFVIEFQGTEKMSTPVKIGEEKILEEKYLGRLVEKANWLLEKNYKRLARLEEEFNKNLE